MPVCDREDVKCLKDLATLRGYTLTSLAEALQKEGVMQVTRQSVSNWNRGVHMPTAEKLGQLANFLDVEITGLFSVLRQSYVEAQENGD